VHLIRSLARPDPVIRSQEVLSNTTLPTVEGITSDECPVDFLHPLLPAVSFVSEPDL